MMTTEHVSYMSDDMDWTFLQGDRKLPCYGTISLHDVRTTDVMSGFAWDWSDNGVAPFFCLYGTVSQQEEK